MTIKKQITIEGIKLEVEFEYTTGEINNFGHPDLRAEDIAHEIEIISIWHEGEDIILLMADWLVADIETMLLREATKQAI